VEIPKTSACPAYEIKPIGPLGAELETNPPTAIPRREPFEWSPAPLGKGGAQHKYLQQFIKRWAEGMGYKATIEKPLPDASGSVDVALEKGALSIACEITVTTSVDHELANVRKCLAAEYAFVAAIATSASKLKEIETRAASVLSKIEQEKVRYVTPETLFEFIESLEAQAASTENTVRGYKVKVNYKPAESSDKSAQKRAVSKVVVGALKRIRGK
jgi:hypothetical protein